MGDVLSQNEIDSLLAALSTGELDVEEIKDSDEKQVKEYDFARPSIETIFSNTPRLMLASLIVYAICQKFDVWAYHKWWAFTSKRCGDSKRFLWLRNNGSTLISQLLNAVLYTMGAFWGLYDIPTLISIALSSYIIFIVTSLADTPVIYLARKMKERLSQPDKL